MFSPKKTLLKMVTHSATVVKIQDVSPCLRRIRLGSESIKKLTWTAGEKIKIRVGSKLRSYTPSSLNPEEGWLEIILFQHGSGLASEWASTLKIGDKTGILGPSKSMPYPTFLPSRVLFLGDETTIGLAFALFNTLPSHLPIEGAIELNQEDQSVLASVPLPLDSAIRSRQREQEQGNALKTWLTQWLGQNDSQTFIGDSQAVIWLSGEAETVLSLKNMLLNQGIASERFYSKPYWSHKGHRHRKAIQRQLK